ncbi:hypothetical protein HMPREF2910_01310 [Staphylococcus sp. HMSC066C03]|uniref:hypothetical protein n=1 Tax=Staphylococcus sp. HMSC066C03 TaxID=1739414 RepID=UPI0008A40B11|nr:hypothetical protein [Staphylococcus sp. HMSC066C03]OFR02157.1 hypothetical protein HMPREF2910_01310 [Staphylococcus sp. HMSC066C03]
MKKVLFLIFASLLVLGACGQDGDNSNKDDNKKSESKSDKKSNDPKKDKKSDSKNKSKDSSSGDKQQASSDDNNNDTANNDSESTSKSDNGKTQSANGNNERPQSKQATQQQNNNQQQSNNNQQQNNNNGYMTQEQINEWNRNKPTTHDESQMGYGRGDYEQALKDSEKVWNNPNAHVGGPRWVGKNEGYKSWAKRQQEVQNTTAQ